MKRHRVGRTAHPFDQVRQVGLTLPGVKATTRYDGSPVLKTLGVFVAGLATHESVEPGTLVVRCDLDDREWLLADAPDTYYLTDYYRSYPLILVRLARVDRDILRDLLTMSLKLAHQKTAKRRAAQRQSSPRIDADKM